MEAMIPCYNTGIVIQEEFLTVMSRSQFFINVATVFVFLFLIASPSFGQDVLENKVVRVLFNNEKGSIRAVTLQNKKYNNLSVFTGESSVFETNISSEESLKFKIVQKDSKSIIFEAASSKIKVTKKYKLSSYKVFLDLSYKNLTDKQVNLKPVIALNIVSSLTAVGEDVIDFNNEKIIKLEEKEYKGDDIKELGLNQTYSLAFFKTTTAVEKYIIGKNKTDKSTIRELEICLPSMTLEKDYGVPFKFEMFAGPKEDGVLATYKYQNILDLNVLDRLLIFILRFFYGMFHNWGISIIMLTIFVKIMLYPLNAKQNKSMAEMQKIQPLVEELKKKYGNEKEKMNQEVLQLYKEHKINPFGGCLPLLIQLPILFALFSTLRTSIELKGEGFLWIKDLSAAEFLKVGNSSIPVLAIVIAVSTYFQMKMQNTGNNPQQSNMQMIMPVMMFFLCQALPAGVLIYWFVSNILAMVQTKLDFGKVKTSPAVAGVITIEKEKKPKDDKSSKDNGSGNKKSKKKKKGAKK